MVELAEEPLDPAEDDEDVPGTRPAFWAAAMVEKLV
jgi:hypothetical protein